jgi:hypothetical protein
MRLGVVYQRVLCGDASPVYGLSFVVCRYGALAGRTPASRQAAGAGISTRTKGLGSARTVSGRGRGPRLRGALIRLVSAPRGVKVGTSARRGRLQGAPGFAIDLAGRWD